MDFGYYLYFPATFIYHDLAMTDFSWLQQTLDTYHPFGALITWIMKRKIWDKAMLDFTSIQNSWVRVTFWLYSPYIYTHNSGLLVITMNHQGTNGKHRLHIYLWRDSPANLYIDDVNVQLFEPKE